MIYRDMKPENTGFDSDGVLKIFDFGQAREVDPRTKDDDGNYQLTGLCGSRRYMAPENLLKIPYGLNVDVYSFGVMLWEMMTLEKSFAGMDSERHRVEVAIGGSRPDIPHSLPLNVKLLIKECWSPKPYERPAFSNIVSRLMAELKSEAYSEVTRKKFDKPKARAVMNTLHFSSNAISVSSGSIGSDSSSSLQSFSRK